MFRVKSEWMLHIIFYTCGLHVWQYGPMKHRVMWPESYNQLKFWLLSSFNWVVPKLLQKKKHNIKFCNEYYLGLILLYRRLRGCLYSLSNLLGKFCFNYIKQLQIGKPKIWLWQLHFWYFFIRRWPDCPLWAVMEPIELFFW